MRRSTIAHRGRLRDEIQSIVLVRSRRRRSRRREASRGVERRRRVVERRRRVVERRRRVVDDATVDRGACDRRTSSRHSSSCPSTTTRRRRVASEVGRGRWVGRSDMVDGSVGRTWSMGRSDMVGRPPAAATIVSHSTIDSPFVVTLNERKSFIDENKRRKGIKTTTRRE